MSLQAYYDEFRCGYWAEPDPTRCLCHGSGWALSDVDTWHECPVHFRGQLHPEDGVFEGGSDEDVEAAETASRAAWENRRNPVATVRTPPPTFEDFGVSSGESCEDIPFLRSA